MLQSLHSIAAANIQAPAQCKIIFCLCPLAISSSFALSPFATLSSQQIFSSSCHLVVGLSGSPVTDELHASDHLANGEEADNLSDCYTGGGKLLAIHVAELAKSLERV